MSSYQIHDQRDSVACRGRWLTVGLQFAHLCRGYFESPFNVTVRVRVGVSISIRVEVGVSVMDRVGDQVKVKIRDVTVPVRVESRVMRMIRTTCSYFRHIAR